MKAQHVLKGDVYCYQVTNFELAYEKDVDVITKLESKLLEQGLFPAKIDWNSKLCCMQAYADYVDLNSVNQIFKSLKLDAIPLGIESTPQKITRACGFCSLSLKAFSHIIHRLIG